MLRVGHASGRGEGRCARCICETAVLDPHHREVPPPDAKGTLIDRHTKCRVLPPPSSKPLAIFFVQALCRDARRAPSGDDSALQHMAFVCARHSACVVHPTKSDS